MPVETISAKNVAHLFGGKASNTPYTPSGEASNHCASPVRQPMAAQKPKALELIFAELWAAHGNGMAPVAEFRFHPERKWRFDWAFVENRCAVELDGGGHCFQGGRHARDSDKEKMNFAASLGWRVLHFSRAMLEDDPCQCAALVAAALEF